MVGLGKQKEVGRTLVKLQPQLGEGVMKRVSRKEARGRATISVFETARSSSMAELERVYLLGHGSSGRVSSGSA
ncbi:hypothetical protein GCM10027187_31510 [Streptosporangium sandarakinum]